MSNFPPDRVKVNTVTTGQGGTVTLGAATSGFFLTPAEAGMVDGRTYDYVIEQGGDFEHNAGVYTASGSTITRGGTAIASKISGTAGTALINMNGTAIVYFPFFNRLFTTLVPACGKLTYSSTTLLKFLPFDGDLIRINGVVYSIPVAGIAGLANTSVFVNGTGGSNLAANTTYYVYAFSNSGVVTADFRTDGNGHIMSDAAGNSGTEVRCSTGTTRDNTRTLIGLIRTVGSALFSDTAAARLVRSWLNDNGKLTSNKYTVDQTGSNAAAPPTEELDTEIRNQIVLWAGESWFLNWTGTIACSTFDDQHTGISVDGAATLISVANNVDPAASLRSTGSASCVATPAEGFHYATIKGSVDTGVGTWYGGGGYRENILNGVSYRN